MWSKLSCNGTITFGKDHIPIPEATLWPSKEWLKIILNPHKYPEMNFETNYQFESTSCKNTFLNENI